MIYTIPLTKIFILKNKFAFFGNYDILYIGSNKTKKEIKKMYTMTISKTICSRYGFFRHLILDGFYVRIGKIIVTLWKN